MKLQETAQGTVVDVYARPKSKQFHVKCVDDGLLVLCREPPVMGRANKELMKGLSKLFGKRVEILSGVTSRRKRVLIRAASPEEVKEILSRHRST
jgi:uncharacterized protein (TIGR00251 family)